MTAISPASPARAGADDDESDTPPETPQQALSALCADIDFNDDLPQATNLGHGILTLLQLPPLRALPKTPLEETILGLKVEVERLVEELDLLRSRSELSGSAHRQAVVDHAVERSALVLQAAQKGELVALAKRDIKQLTDELETTSTNANELNSANLLFEEKARLSELYITYLEAGHAQRAPAGGIVLKTKPRFSASTWLALGAMRRSKDLMAKEFLIPEGVLVRPFIAWVV
jgi:uncharacterized protein (DUF1778 family)